MNEVRPTCSGTSAVIRDEGFRSLKIAAESLTKFTRWDRVDKISADMCAFGGDRRS